MFLQLKPSDPLITDRWVDVAYGALWSIYTMWGATVLFVGLPTMTANTPDWYQALWSVSIAILSAIAAISAFSLFFRIPKMDLVRKKTIELGTVIALTVFIAVYPALLFVSAIGGDHDRLAIAFLGLSYLVFPILRVHMLRQRIKGYIKASKEIQANGND